MSKSTEKPVRRGFSPLPCPLCGAEDGVSISLAELTGDEALSCCECEATFPVSRVRDMISRWQAVLAWIEQAPLLGD